MLTNVSCVAVCLQMCFELYFLFMFSNESSRFQAPSMDSSLEYTYNFVVCFPPFLCLLHCNLCFFLFCFECGFETNRILYILRSKTMAKSFTTDNPYFTFLKY